MKNQYLPLYKLLCLFFLLMFVETSSLQATENFRNFRFRQLSTSDGLSTNDIQQVYQDKEGYIWMATRNGLAKYNGYEMKINNYRSVLMRLLHSRSRFVESGRGMSYR